MNPITFFVQGVPKGQPRPRAFARKMGDKFVARVYDAGTAEGWKSQVAIAAKEHPTGVPWALYAPMLVHLEFFFPRPKSHYRSGKHSSELREEAPGYHLSKPDSDNAAKAVIDALTTLGFYWRDDAQIAHLIVRKLYDDGRGSGCLVRIQQA